jgi:hypothetical protein
MVVHGSWNISSTSYLILRWKDAGGAKEESCGWWCAELEVEGAVWSDCYARWYWGSDCVVGCSCVELLTWSVRPMGLGYATK